MSGCFAEGQSVCWGGELLAPTASTTEMEERAHTLFAQLILNIVQHHPEEAGPSCLGV